MTALYGGFALRQVEQVYNKVLNAALEVLVEFANTKLLDQPLDQEKWIRKVFKVYKTMNMLEKKKHTKPYYCKRLFKLVFVLFKMQKEVPKAEIWRQLQLQSDETDDGASAANSSVLGCVISEGTVERDRSSQAAGLNDSHYSNFKAAHANMFTINSSNNLLPEKHSSLSPKISKTVNPADSSHSKENNNARKYHSTLNKKSHVEERQNHKLSSPLIRNHAIVDHQTMTFKQQDEPTEQQANLSQATFNERRDSKPGRDSDALVYADFSQQDSQPAPHLVTHENSSTNVQAFTKSMRPLTGGSQTHLHQEPYQLNQRKVIKQRPTSHYQIVARGRGNINNKNMLKNNIKLGSGHSLKSASGTVPVMDRRGQRKHRQIGQVSEMQYSEMQSIPDNFFQNNVEQSLDDATATERSIRNMGISNRNRPSLNKALKRKASLSKRSDREATFYQVAPKPQIRQNSKVARHQHPVIDKSLSNQGLRKLQNEQMRVASNCSFGGNQTLEGISLSPNSTRLRHNNDQDNFSEFMNGVRIQQVKPVAQKYQYSVKPPKPVHSQTLATGDYDQHPQRQRRSKNERNRPTTTINSNTKKRITSNMVGLKDLLFRGQDFVSASSSQKGGVKKSATTNRANSNGYQFPINNIQTNTFIIQINNQPVKLPQNDLAFVMDSQEVKPTNSKYTKINRRIRLKHSKERTDSIPDTQMNSMPSEICHENSSTQHLASEMATPQQRLGTSTPDDFDIKKGQSLKVAGHDISHLESNDTTSQQMTRQVSHEYSTAQEDVMRLGSQRNGCDSTSIEGNRITNSALIVEENQRMSGSRDLDYRHCSTATLEAIEVSGKINKDSLEIVREAPPVQPKSMSPAQQNYAKLKTPPAEPRAQPEAQPQAADELPQQPPGLAQTHQQISANMLADYCASQELLRASGNQPLIANATGTEKCNTDTVQSAELTPSHQQHQFDQIGSQITFARAQMVSSMGSQNRYQKILENDENEQVDQGTAGVEQK